MLLLIDISDGVGEAIRWRADHLLLVASDGTGETTASLRRKLLLLLISEGVGDVTRSSLDAFQRWCKIELDNFWVLGVALADCE